VTSGCELEEVELCDVDALDSWDVSEGSPQLGSLGGGVYEEWSSSLYVLSVSVLAVSSSDRLGLDGLVDVLIGVYSLEKGKGIL